MSQRLLVVDDEADFITGFRRVLARDDIEVHAAHSGEEALRWLQANGRPDVIFMDLRMPGMDGLVALKRIRELDDRVIIILMTAHTTTATVIEAMKCGAYDFIGKPFSAEKLRQMVQEALKVSSDMKSVVTYQPAREVQASDIIVGSSDVMKEVYKAIGQVAASDATVLITGESGTGKELVAKAIYHHSERTNKPFIAVNCAAIPENLLESELFGHEKGSFSGAVSRKPGKFEVARYGTIFLDEIGDMSLSTQTKILRVLQDGTFQRVGGTETLFSDVRVIAATNKDLPLMIRRGEFRADVYYRLNVVHIEMPPLRERREDIPQLVDYFLDRIRRETGRKVPTISEAAMERLLAHNWPGNVRELENVLRNLVLTAKTETVLAGDLRLRGDLYPQDPYSSSAIVPKIPVTPPPASEPTTPLPGESSALARLAVQHATSHPEDFSSVPSEGATAVLETASGGDFSDVEQAVAPLFDRLVEARRLGHKFSTFDVMERALILHALNTVGGNQVQAARLLGITRSTLRKRILRYGLVIDTKVRG